MEGIDYFGKPWPHFSTLGARPVIGEGQVAIADPRGPAAAYQTLLVADVLRYLTLQITGAKASGHPGGFASSAEAVAALILLGHKNLVTEVGHHAPGYYSAMFLDTSLEAMGIHSVKGLCALSQAPRPARSPVRRHPRPVDPRRPAWPRSTFALAGASLHRDKLFSVTIGDVGMNEPYVLSSFLSYRLSGRDQLPAGIGVERL